MRILFYISSPATYQIDFFKELKKKNEVFVVYKNFLSENNNFKLKKLSWMIFPKKIDNLFFEKLISKIKPELLIIGGYKMKIDDSIIKKNNIKKFYWLERLNNQNKLKKIIRSYYLKLKLKNANGIFAIGQEATNYYKKYNNNIFNIPYSINKQSKIRTNDIPRFLFVGQYIQRKGISKLIKSIHNIDTLNCKFTFVGEGPLKKEIIKLSKNKLNISCLKFKSKNELNQVYNKNNILILPSNYDGWGVVLIEAMARGMAIITNKNVGAANEYIKHNYNGRIFSNKDNSLAKEINFYIQNYKKIKVFGKRNRVLFEKSLCNTSNVVNKLNKILKINNL